MEIFYVRLFYCLYKVNIDVRVIFVFEFDKLVCEVVILIFILW